uniref:EGF-like domain-containing protein n=1 Tax=Acrobeloides nanus TaxID=290746 RepID=A0A914DR95_9BILA
MDNDVSYECLCKEGYIDMSVAPAVRPGVKCRRLVNECRVPLQNDCDQNAYCIDKPIGFTCRCQEGFTDISDLGAKRPGRKCRKLINECAIGMANCDPVAICTDTIDGFSCRCPPGFLDVSGDPIGNPGRICAQLISDCDEASCNSNFSRCTETVSGTVCKCLPGYIDLDPENPGRKCKKSQVVMFVLPFVCSHIEQWLI